MISLLGIYNDALNRASLSKITATDEDSSVCEFLNDSYIWVKNDVLNDLHYNHHI